MSFAFGFFQASLLVKERGSFSTNQTDRQHKIGLKQTGQRDDPLAPVLSMATSSNVLLDHHCTDAVFCLEFCGKSRQKQHPYIKIDMELCPKDLYSLFESRLRK